MISVGLRCEVFGSLVDVNKKLSQFVTSNQLARPRVVPFNGTVGGVLPKISRVSEIHVTLTISRARGPQVPRSRLLGTVSLPQRLHETHAGDGPSCFKELLFVHLQMRLCDLVSSSATPH